MEPVARRPYEEPWFEECVPVARLHGGPQQAARALEEEWLPLLGLGPRHLVISLDEVDRLDSAVLAGLTRILEHVRQHGGDLALVATRPELHNALRHWALKRSVPVLPHAYAAVMSVCERRRSERQQSIAA